MSNNVNDLQDYVKYLALKLVKECKNQGIEIKIVQTLRSFKEQANIYAQGRTKPGKIVTNAKAVYSYHNYGLAFDICPLVNGKLAWDRKDLFEKAGKIGKQIGLEWGGNFKSIKDLPHFQYSGGITISSLLRGERPKYPAAEAMNIYKDDKELLNVVNKLKEKGMINTPKYWIENAISGKEINGEYLSSLIKKLAFMKEGGSLSDAINILKEKDIITTPDYWTNNAIKGKKVNGEYVNFLIKRYIKYLG